MFTTTQLDEDAHPILHAFAIQNAIERLQNELAGLQIEYEQLIQKCKEKGIDKQDGLSIVVKRKGIRKVDPTLFARTFPAENALLVQKEAAFIGTELDKLVQTKILPKIAVKDAEELVGKIPLMKACTMSMTERTVIAKDGEE